VPTKSILNAANVPANNPWTERKLPESRTRLERLGERGSEQRVRVGDVEHAVAADGEAAGMSAWARQRHRRRTCDCS
jgi:hypothetical protein